jgi:hypothetical protein
MLAATAGHQLRADAGHDHASRGEELDNRPILAGLVRALDHIFQPGANLCAMTPAVRAHGCNGMDERELEDRCESSQRQLSPAADMPPQMLTAAMCHKRP